MANTCPLFPCPSLWLIVWDARTAEDPDTMRTPPGLPVRVLLDGTARLPEQAFLDCRDVQTARVVGPDAAMRQVRAWLEELEDAHA
jgi:hypothetical protein